MITFAGSNVLTVIPFTSSQLRPVARAEPTLFDQIYGSGYQRRPAMTSLNEQWVPVADRLGTYQWSNTGVDSPKVKTVTFFGTGEMRGQQQQTKATTPPGSNYTDAYLSAFAPKPIPTRHINRLSTTVFDTATPVSLKPTFVKLQTVSPSASTSTSTSQTRFAEVNNNQPSTAFERNVPSSQPFTYRSNFSPEIPSKSQPFSSTQYSYPQSQTFTSSYTTSLRSPSSVSSMDTSSSKDTPRSSYSNFQSRPQPTPFSTFPTFHRLEPSYHNIYKPMPAYSTDYYPPSNNYLSSLLSTVPSYKPPPSTFPSLASYPSDQSTSTKQTTVSPSIIEKPIDRPETLLFQPDEDIQLSRLEKPSPIITPSPESPMTREELKIEPARLRTEDTPDGASKPIEILENTLSKYDSLINQISEVLASVSPLSSTVSSLSPGKSVLDYQLSSDSSPILPHKRVEPQPSQQSTTSKISTTQRSKASHLIRDDSYDKIVTAISDLDSELTPPPSVDKSQPIIVEEKDETKTPPPDDQQTGLKTAPITEDQQTSPSNISISETKVDEDKLQEVQATTETAPSNEEFVQQQTGLLATVPSDETVTEQTAVPSDETESNKKTSKHVSWGETITDTAEDEEEPSSSYQSLTEELNAHETAIAAASSMYDDSAINAADTESSTTDESQPAGDQQTTSPVSIEPQTALSESSEQQVVSSSSAPEPEPEASVTGEQITSSDSTDQQITAPSAAEPQVTLSESSEQQIASPTSISEYEPTARATEEQITSSDSTDQQTVTPSPAEPQKPLSESSEQQIVSSSASVAEEQIKSSDSTDQQIAGPSAVEPQAAFPESSEQQAVLSSSAPELEPKAGVTEEKITSLDFTEQQTVAPSPAELQAPFSESSEQQIISPSSASEPEPKASVTEEQITSSDSTDQQIAAPIADESQATLSESPEQQIVPPTSISESEPSASVAEEKIISSDSAEQQIAAPSSVEPQAILPESSEQQTVLSSFTPELEPQASVAEEKMASTDSTDQQIAAPSADESQATLSESSEQQIVPPTSIFESEPKVTATEEQITSSDSTDQQTVAPSPAELQAILPESSEQQIISSSFTSEPELKASVTEEQIKSSDSTDQQIAAPSADESQATLSESPEQQIVPSTSISESEPKAIATEEQIISSDSTDQQTVAPSSTEQQQTVSELSEQQIVPPTSISESEPKAGVTEEKITSLDFTDQQTVAPSPAEPQKTLSELSEQQITLSSSAPEPEPKASVTGEQIISSGSTDQQIPGPSADESQATLLESSEQQIVSSSSAPELEPSASVAEEKIISSDSAEQQIAAPSSAEPQAILPESSEQQTVLSGSTPEPESKASATEEKITSSDSTDQQTVAPSAVEPQTTLSESSEQQIVSPTSISEYELTARTTEEEITSSDFTEQHTVLSSSAPEPERKAGVTEEQIISSDSTDEQLAAPSLAEPQTSDAEHPVRPSSPTVPETTEQESTDLQTAHQESPDQKAISLSSAEQEISPSLPIEPHIDSSVTADQQVRSLESVDQHATVPSSSELEAGPIESEATLPESTDQQIVPSYTTDQQLTTSDSTETRTISTEEPITTESQPIAESSQENTLTVDDASTVSSSVVHDEEAAKTPEETQVTSTAPEQEMSTDDNKIESTLQLAKSDQQESPTTVSEQVVAEESIPVIESPIDTLTSSIATRYISSDVYYGYLGEHEQSEQITSDVDNDKATKSLLASLRDTIGIPLTPLIETIQGVVSNIQTTTVHPSKKEVAVTDHDQEEARVSTTTVSDTAEEISDEKTQLEETKSTTDTSDESKSVLESIRETVSAPFTTLTETIQTTVSNLRSNKDEISSEQIESALQSPPLDEEDSQQTTTTQTTANEEPIESTSKQEATTTTIEQKPDEIISEENLTINEPVSNEVPEQTETIPIEISSETKTTFETIRHAIAHPFTTISETIQNVVSNLSSDQRSDTETQKTDAVENLQFQDAVVEQVSPTISTADVSSEFAIVSEANTKAILDNVRQLIDDSIQQVAVELQPESTIESKEQEKTEKMDDGEIFSSTSDLTSPVTVLSVDEKSEENQLTTTQESALVDSENAFTWTNLLGGGTSTEISFEEIKQLLEEVVQSTDNITVEIVEDTTKVILPHSSDQPAIIDNTVQRTLILPQGDDTMQRSSTELESDSTSGVTQIERIQQSKLVPSAIETVLRESSPANTEADTLELINTLQRHSIVSSNYPVVYTQTTVEQSTPNMIAEKSDEQLLPAPEKSSSSTTTSSQVTSSDRYVSYAIHEMGDSSQERLPPAIPLATDIPIYEPASHVFDVDKQEVKERKSKEQQDPSSEPPLVLDRQHKDDDLTELDATENLTYSDDVLLQRLAASAPHRETNLDASSTDDDVDDDNLNELERQDASQNQKIVDEITSSISGGEAYHRYDVATTSSSSSSPWRQTEDVYMIPGYPGLWRPPSAGDEAQSSRADDADDEGQENDEAKESTTTVKTRTIVRTSDPVKLQSLLQHHQEQTAAIAGAEELIGSGVPLRPGVIDVFNRPLNEFSFDISESDSFKTCHSSSSISKPLPSQSSQLVEVKEEEEQQQQQHHHEESPDEIFLIRERERGVSLPVTMKIDYDDMALRLSASSPIDSPMYSTAHFDRPLSAAHSEPAPQTASSSRASSPSLSSSESEQHQQRSSSWLKTVNTTTTTEGPSGPLEARTTLLKSAKGPICIAECDAQGRSIVVENTSRSKSVALAGWIIRQETDQGETLTFTFPDNCLLRPNHSLKIYTKTSESDRKNGDLVASSLSTWHTGSNVVTTLINADGKDRASLTKKTLFS